MPGLVPLLIAAALFGGGAVAVAATRSGPPSASAAATTSPTTSPPVLLSENDACVQLNPLLLQASEIYAAFMKSDDVPKTEDARRLADQLRAIRKIAPEDMGPDIGQIVKGLVLLPAGGAGINFEDWQQAGINLHKRCIGAR